MAILLPQFSMTRTEREVKHMANTNKRGFASMSEEKQRQIASKGGKIISQDRGHMAEIGKKGGLTRKEELGEEGYKALGQKGGESTAQEHQHDEFYKTIGKKGGATRKKDLGTQGYSKLGQMGGRAPHSSRGRKTHEEEYEAM